MIERKIKELSIALEALSRINGADEYFNPIARLLQLAIVQAEKEYNPQPTNPNDDIPF